jgi:hypothetical protein
MAAYRSYRDRDREGSLYPMADDADARRRGDVVASSAYSYGLSDPRRVPAERASSLTYGGARERSSPTSNSAYGSGTRTAEAVVTRAPNYSRGASSRVLDARSPRGDDAGRRASARLPRERIQFVRRVAHPAP